MKGVCSGTERESRMLFGVTTRRRIMFICVAAMMRRVLLVGLKFKVPAGAFPELNLHIPLISSCFWQVLTLSTSSSGCSGFLSYTESVIFKWTGQKVGRSYGS